jgi:predicted phage terminase large subunit-like protein
MRSDLYRRTFPNTRISPAKDTETEFTTTLGGGRLATSVGGTLTGRGAAFVIIDDPMKPQDAYSEAARESVKNWYANTLLSRLDAKTKDAIVLVMQRLHVDDLAGHLLQDEGWRHLNLPAIAEIESTIPLSACRIHHRNVGDLLHAEREPRHVLDDLRRQMGSLDFSAQYQQQPVAEGGNLIKWSWFGTYNEMPVVKSDDRIIVSWDTALTAKELSSYSVCVVLLVRNDTVFVLDVIRKRLDYPDLKRAVVDTHRQWRNAPANYALLIENKGSGMSLIQDLKREGYRAIAIEPEGDKIMRMQAQTARIEAGSVFLPPHAPWLEDFRGELLAFPAGRYSDQVDALSQGLKRAFEKRERLVAYGLQGCY